MGVSTLLQYRVLLTKDLETRSVVAEIPILQIADFLADVPDGQERLEAMLGFHLDCLREEGKPIPSDKGAE